METESPSGKVKVKEVEDLIKSIQGVTDCRIVINDWGAVEEVHVLASSERPAKGIARDVESAMAARFGMDIDHKKISVAQLGTPSPMLPAEYRIRIKGHRLDVNQADRTASLQVELLTPIGTVVSGEATGTTERRSLVRMAGQATTSAIDNILPPARRLVLEEVLQMTVAGREIVLALMSAQGERGNDTLIGTATMVSGEEIGCAVKACLDAVNRRLSLFISN